MLDMVAIVVVCVYLVCGKHTDSGSRWRFGQHRRSETIQIGDQNRKMALRDHSNK